MTWNMPVSFTAPPLRWAHQLHGRMNSDWEGAEGANTQVVDQGEVWWCQERLDQSMEGQEACNVWGRAVDKEHRVGD